MSNVVYLVSTKRHRCFVTSSPHPIIPSSRHIIHLSYNLARPSFTDPEKWLERVAFTRGVAEKLLSYGPQTVIYNIHYKGELMRNGVNYIFSGCNKLQLLLPFGFNRRVKKLRPDVVLVHGLIFPWQVIMLRMTLGPRVKIISQHHAERPFKDFRRALAKKADQYIGAYLFASKTQGEEWVKAGQISTLSKVHEVMGTSSIFQADPRRKEENVYLWIGDLDKNKDPLLVAKAFTKFSRGRNAKLLMIYQQRQLEDELKEIVNASVELIGKVEHSELQNYFNRATYIISTSHYEGSGIAVCEAMSCGCIPILTDIPSFRAMTGNWKVGRSFKAGDADDLVGQLDQPFDRSQSQKIIDHFNSELSFEANARKIISIINQL